MNELVYHNFNASADLVGGDMMLVLTANSTLDEIGSYILSNKIMWFYDGDKYRQIFAFKDEPSALIVYYFDDAGLAVSHRFGDE